tara:strand:- start:365 stop:619 length:255 start_codon:yes stop_codon:yes gene_type:complete
MKIRLLHGTRPTNKFYILAHPGSTPTRRQKGYSDYNDYEALEKAGWLGKRTTGPRGGKTWWPTRKGKYHLAKARKILALNNLKT